MTMSIYTGKNINYIQKLADKSGFGIKYQDASANELDLTSLSDDVKKDVIASSACQYNDIAKTAIVTVAYTGDDQSVVLPVLNEGTTVKAPEATVPTEAPTATPTPTSIPTPTPIPKNKITKLTIETDDDLEFHIGEPAYNGTAKVTLKYPNRYIDTKIVFVSEHPEVATIKNLSKKANTDQLFEISPVAVGETYVYAKTSDGYITSNRIKVVVNGPIEAESIYLNEEETTLYVGDSINLYAYITPTNAVNKKITWSSSDTSVVTVTPGGVVKAVSCGDAEVTATTSNGLSATCYVSVIMDDSEEKYDDNYVAQREMKLKYTRSGNRGANIGKEWSFAACIDDESVQNGSTYTFNAYETIVIYCWACEDDNYPDEGANTEYYTVTEDDLINGFTVEVEVYVTENRGRNANQSAYFVYTFEFSPVK